MVSRRGQPVDQRSNSLVRNLQHGTLNGGDQQAGRGLLLPGRTGGIRGEIQQRHPAATGCRLCLFGVHTDPLSEAGILSEPLRWHLSFLVEEYGKETAMRTYYRGPDALVTQERFVWRTSSPRIFVVRELQNAVLVRCNVPDRRPNPALLVALTMAALAAASWMLVGPAVGRRARLPRGARGGRRDWRPDPAGPCTNGRFAPLTRART